ncbi:MAG: iron ABC transporter permease [Armatimonadota bacterium]|nr:iron ABC transporter permease [Armatimonadota bacterium]MDR5675577.1 iron ABC transporter permease [Armatimonadota bacterium]MDR5690038.1 iron ABC transporter permease [Armatimonadota bacterium]MDR7388082.1 iron ABC transporter permease [Armatimonadota bacterium]MDR7392801.1 iron ABC transporter permease [Armatimonadota bacterium]
MGRLGVVAAGVEARRQLADPGLALAFVGGAAALGLFVLYPTVRVLLYPTVHDYLTIPQSVRWIQAARNSLVSTVLSTSTAVLVGLAFAFAITRPDVPGRRFFRTVALLPLFAPPFMVAFSYILLFGRQGLVTRHLLGLDVNIFGLYGLWLAQTVAFFPLAMLVIAGVLESVSPSLEHAARNLGADEWQVARTVTLALARPGIAGAALVVAISVLADFGNAVVIAGGWPLLATEAWFRLEGMADLRGASLVVAMLVVPTTGLFLLERYWVGRRRYTTITGRGGRLERPPTYPPLKWAAFSVCALTSVLVVLIYLGVVAGAFTAVWGRDWSITLDHWRLASDRVTSLWASLRVAAGAGLGTAVAGILLAFLTSRPVPLRRALDFLAVLPGALPGVFVGVGFVLAFNRPPLELVGTPWILVLALAFWHLPLGYQAAVAQLQQIDRSIEEAASNLGARGLHLLRDVYLPLLARAFVEGFTVSFVRAVTNVSIAVFLVSPGNVVATFAILNMIGNGIWGGAAALTTMLLLVTFAALAAARVAAGRALRPVPAG